MNTPAVIQVKSDVKGVEQLEQPHLCSLLRAGRCRIHSILSVARMSWQE